MRLSVIIATLERPRICAHTVAVVARQLDHGDELVVVDQSAEDARRRLAASLAPLGPRVRHLGCEVAGLPNARNVGLAQTSAPGVLFLDDDAVALPGLLEAHRRALEGGHTVVAGRIVEARVEPNALRLCNRLDRSGRVRTRLDAEHGGWVESPKGANMAYIRSAVERVGGFDLSYGGTAFLEEADVAAAIGAPVWFEPDAAVLHLSASSGGVRPPGAAREAERWRFHNTALYLRRHRSLDPGFPLVFFAIAMVRGAQWRAPGEVLGLLGAAVSGWRSARYPAQRGEQP